MSDGVQNTNLIPRPRMDSLPTEHLNTTTEKETPISQAKANISKIHPPIDNDRQELNPLSTEIHKNKVRANVRLK